ncbi:MAG TPA: hypothetical protein VK468_10185 [Pyrinomonadaceae bacterium]|nr:hypothetical protein [Pyrinomonadaceae bacterium]
MKQYPTCHSQYTDDTLQFCLQDGTRLEWLPLPSETETVVSSRRTAGYTNEPPSEHRRKPRTGLIVFASAVATVLVLGVLGVGYLIVSRGARQRAAAENLNVNVNQQQAEAKPTPSPTPSATPTPANANTQPTPDMTQTSREVTKAIAGWESDTESLDIDDLADRYADRVDYYRTPGANRDFVKRDKERAFSMYDSVELQISGIKISPGKTPDSAVAEFDKAWTFDGDRHSEGKVRSRLTMTKIDGKWLIDGEQDIKVY